MTYKEMKGYNVFQYANGNEVLFEMVVSDFGYERKTTFFSDLSIAEWCKQERGVRDTYENVMRSWLDNIEYITEFCMCLNHKIWQHHKDNEPLAKVYDELWQDCDARIIEHYKEDEEALDYYYRTTD